jgi:hypothetical protein
VSTRASIRAALGGILVAGSLGLAAREARAVVDPRFSSISPVVVGNSSGVPMHEAASSRMPATNGYTVTVRDVNNAPEFNRIVKLDFSQTTVRLYTVQESGCTVDCVAHTLTGSSGISGTIVFHPRFGGSVNEAMVEVTAAGVVLGEVPARSTDMDAQGGTTGLADFGLFGPLFLAGATDHPEADFDASGGPIGLSDFAIFAREYLLQAQGSYCP